MSRLSDLYKAMVTLRKEVLFLNEDLERQVSELEVPGEMRTHQRTKYYNVMNKTTEFNN